LWLGFVRCSRGDLILDWAFDKGSFLEDSLGADQATRRGPLTARQQSWAESMSLNAIARSAALDLGPLVTLVRSRTVANVDSIGF
jgi:hypothetical protein